MVFRKLLVPTDGSMQNMKAVETAVQMAKENSGSITALYVIDRATYSEITNDAAVAKSYEYLEDEAREAVESVKTVCNKADVPCEVRVKDGTPYRVIIESSSDFDLIVMGTLGRSGISKLMMGSVAEKVIKNSKCPVLVVSSKGEKK